ncbi:hypothetical protein H5410_014707 [Solanum commersonii]|uniref:Secreted protein n=1 Tax=Solanum commersonii TaxID=4109 RepID=A0A9J5ZS02_SOLCO|nr:hypothetical protein H5410_014707 [Solanum commersonii]
MSCGLSRRVAWRLMACMVCLCYAVGRLHKHADDGSGVTVCRLGAFGRVESSRAPVTANSRSYTHGERKAMYNQTLSVG